MEIKSATGKSGPPNLALLKTSPTAHINGVSDLKVFQLGFVDRFPCRGKTLKPTPPKNRDVCAIPAREEEIVAENWSLSASTDAPLLRLGHDIDPALAAKDDPGGASEGPTAELWTFPSPE